MLLKIYKTPVFCCLFFLTITGCAKQTSYYYPDPATPGTAIFSNTGNNVLSCLVDGKPWRTITRSVGGALFTRPVYEVFIERHITNSPMDTLSIIWLGDASSFRGNNSTISLGLPVAKSFQITDLVALQNKRIIIDSSNGFFQVNMNGLPAGNAIGKGSIYFNRLSFEAVGVNAYTGYMSGLLEADFGSLKILSGRFDHFMNADQLKTY